MDLFYGKEVLDIGCNIGHVTFSVARDFGAKSVVGMDIDRKLINIARKNVQYYITDTSESSHLAPNYQFNDYAPNDHADSNCDPSELFPISLPMLYGPINIPGMTISGRFPYNVSFVQVSIVITCINDIFTIFLYKNLHHLYIFNIQVIKVIRTFSSTITKM